MFAAAAKRTTWLSALVLGMVGGEVAQGPGRVLLHARALGVAAHRRDQGLDPPLRVCA